ncbi:DUF1704 domain-containing protein [Candidatus Woesearchaeota archaeon]|nr:DUF1704 domain-containing protein [Nanoarchaeota archaeon]MCB9371009.1 DUF1704 domain-containing protein [Candidatus Woesearchaeota archaeon]USN44120.1 MAG: DUF1704 domain-containing protein [Candidatus Woesearchaeota archaeon]
MQITQRHKEIDSELLKLDKLILPITYSNVTNAKEQQRTFLEGEVENPDLITHFVPLKYDPNETENKLRTLEERLGEGPIDALLRKKLETCLTLNEIILYRGTPKVKELTADLYQKPDQQTREQAHNYLLQNPPFEEPEDQSAEKLRDKILEVTQTLLSNWSVKIEDNSLLFKTISSKRTFVIPRKNYSANAIERLPYHEVEVHGLRGENGHAQELTMLGIGLAGYLQTEEGLASFWEKVNGFEDVKTLRSYAGRVIAVDEMHNDKTFRECFDTLKSYQFTDDEAYLLTFRAYRAGGFGKDHIYFIGKQEVENYLAKLDPETRRKETELLWTGKIGLQDIPLISQLMDEDILRRPKILPLNFHEKMARYFS